MKDILKQSIRTAFALAALWVITGVYSAHGAVIIRDDFENSSTSCWVPVPSGGALQCNGWSEITGKILLNTNSAVAHSGSKSVVIHYTADEQSGGVSQYGLNWTELYVRYWQLYPTGFTGRNLKQSLAWANDPPGQGAMISSLWGAGATNLNYSYNEDLGNYINWPVPVNTWFKTSYYIKYNTPGQNNGIYRIWKDDVLIFERTNVNYRSTNVNGQKFWIGGNYSGAGVNPVPFDRYVDDICAANTPADCGDGGSVGISVPTAPASLSVQ